MDRPPEHSHSEAVPGRRDLQECRLRYPSSRPGLGPKKGLFRGWKDPKKGVVGLAGPKGGVVGVMRVWDHKVCGPNMAQTKVSFRNFHSVPLAGLWWVGMSGEGRGTTPMPKKNPIQAWWWLIGTWSVAWRASLQV